MQLPRITGIERWHPAWVGIVGVLIYAPTVRFGFVDYDDPWVIRDNMLLHTLSLESLRSVFLDFSFEQRLRLGAEYLPVRDLSVMLDYAIFGDWIGGQHLTQVLLYGAACAFAAAFIDIWTGNRPLAWITGVFWAVHPVHVESAAWLSERKGVLGAVLLFASLWLLGRFRAHPRMSTLVGASLLLVMAIWSRAPTVVAVGAAAALYLWFPVSGGDSRRAFRGLVVYALIGAVAFIPVFIASASTGLVSPPPTRGLLDTFFLSVQVHGKYLALMALAGPYGIDYPLRHDPRLLLYATLGLMGAMAAVAVCAIALLRRAWRSPLTFGVAWWVILGLPISHLMVSIQNPIADRYLLLPSLGLLMTLASALLELRPKLSIALVVSWTIASLLWTVPQVHIWSSPRALREHMTRFFPHDAESWSNLARVALAERRPVEAWSITEKGLMHAPGDRRLLHRQAIILDRTGHPDEAIRVMTLAANAGPQAHKAQADLALLLLRVGRHEEALSWASRAVLAQGETASNHRALGLVALASGQLELACAAFDRAVQLDPYDPEDRSYIKLCERTRVREAPQ